jgi:hypothetical protein
MTDGLSALKTVAISRQEFVQSPGNLFSWRPGAQTGLTVNFPAIIVAIAKLAPRLRRIN